MEDATLNSQPKTQRNPKSLENLKEHSWKPGQSGNPAGKAKGTKNRSTIMREFLEARGNKWTNPETGELMNLTNEQMITIMQIEKAKEKDTQAYKACMDSAYGQAPVELNHTIENVEPIVFQSWGVPPPPDVEDMEESA